VAGVSATEPAAATPIALSVSSFEIPYLGAVDLLIHNYVSGHYYVGWLVF